MTPPPPLSDITSSDSWKDLSDEDKRTVIGGWQQHASAYGEANVAGWNEDHAIAIHNAGAEALTGQRYGGTENQVGVAGLMNAAGLNMSPGEVAQLSSGALSPEGKFLTTDFGVRQRHINEPLVTLPKPEGDSVIAGVTRGMEGAIEGLTSPLNLALMAGIGGAPAALQKAASLGFAGYMGSQLPAAKEAIGNANTPGERAQAITDFILTAGLTAAAGAHFLGEHAPTLREAGMPQSEIDRITAQLTQGGLGERAALAPETAKALQETPSKPLSAETGGAAPPETTAEVPAALAEGGRPDTRTLYNWGETRPDTLAPGRKDYDAGPAGSWWFTTSEKQGNYGPNLHEAQVTLRHPAIEESTEVTPAIFNDMRAAMKEATGSEALPFTIEQRLNRGLPVTMTDLLSFTGREFAEKIAQGGKLNNRAVRAAFTKVMEDHGFDGMELKNGTQIVAFRPEYVSRLKVRENAGQTPSAPAEAPAAAESTPAGEPAQPGEATIIENKPSRFERRGFKLPTGPQDEHFAANAIVQEIGNQGGILSRSSAKKSYSAEQWDRHKGEWDDAPEIAPTHNSIYKSDGLKPNEMASALVDRGLLPPGSTEAEMWKAIGAASKSATTFRQQQAAQRRNIADATRQGRAFDKAARDKSQPAIAADELKVGDTVKVGTETMKVTHVDPDTFDVTLEDGKKFGVQEVKDGEVIYGEHESAPEAADQFQAKEAPLPQLRQGERQGDLLSKQTEDLKLVGEKGADTLKLAEEKAAAEKNAAEAKATQDKEQAQLFAPKTERVNPLDQLRALEADAQASPADAKAEKMVSVLRKLGRVNRDATKAVNDELRYYSDEELTRLQEHLGTKDAKPQTIARAITGREVLKETERPGGYKNEPSGPEGRKDAPEIEAQAKKDQFGEDYVGGPGAMGPREAAAMEAGQTKTGIRNAIVDEERVKRGLPPRVAPMRRTFGLVWDQAMRLFDANENVGRDLVASLKAKARPLTDLEDAVLTHEQLMRHEAFDEAVENVNKAETPEEKAQANAALEKARADVFDVYDAGSRSGTESGRGLSARRLMVKEDYSLAKMEARKVAEIGGTKAFNELPQEAREKLLSDVKSAHEKIAALEQRVTESEQALSEASGHEEMARIYEAEMRDLQREASKQTKISKPILDIARGIVDRLNTRADAARVRLKDRLSRMSAGVDPTIVLDVAEIMAAHIGEIGLKSAEVSARVLGEFGDKVKPYLNAAWKKARELIEAEKAPPEVKKAIRKTGVGKKEPTPGEIKAKIKADAVAGEELSQKYVADLVRTHIKAGVHGENAVMKAVHQDVREAYPDATERDVRRAYVEYGKVRFPSKEAIATEMRELTALVRLQESIDRETGGLDSLHTGLQRDKATQAIREKQKQLNELLKKRQGPPSPEKLASRDEAKQTALRNAIDDLDKQLRTGERPVKGAPVPDSAATEQLRAERDAMREKLREIEREANPPKSEAEKQVEQLWKQKQRLDNILAGKAEKTSPKPFEALSKEAETLKAEIQSMHELAAQLKREANPKDSNAAREKAQIKRLEDAAKKYEEKLNAADFSAREKGAPRPDTEKVAAARAVMEARREAYEAAKKSGRPVRTPEEIYNATQATRLKNRLAELQDKNARGDYTRPPKRVPPKLSVENEKAKAELERERDKFEEGLARDRKKNRTISQKFWDRFVGVERAMKLSSDVVLLKLTLAAGIREVSTPAEELAGGVISKVLPELAARAPREGGASLAAEIKAKREMFTRGMADAWNNLRMRKSDLEATYGKKGQAPPEWYEYFGFLHGALKAPAKRAEFARSLEKRMLHAARNGVDLNDPAVMRRLAQESYVDGQRAIFMQDNVISSGFSTGLHMMEQSKTSPRLGPAMARLGRFLFPIVKVPTNMVGEVATGVHGLVSGGVRAALAYVKGIESLPPAEADAIMRQLKKGVVGNAFLLAGYYGYKSIGGFYQHRDKREESDVQPEHIRIGGVDLPPFASHSQAGMLLNIGATLHRVEEQPTKNGVKGMGAGALAAGSGLVKQLPFVPVMTKGIEALDTDEGFRHYLNDLVTSSATPALTQHIAKVMDTPGDFPQNMFHPANKRRPANAVDAVKMGIPGMRQQVPPNQRRGAGRVR